MHITYNNISHVENGDRVVLAIERQFYRAAVAGGVGFLMFLGLLVSVLIVMYALSLTFELQEYSSF